MKREFKAISQANANLGISLNSWQTLTCFTVVVESVNSLFMHNVDTHTFTLKERGAYTVEIALNLITDLETSLGLQVRLNIAGVPRPAMAKGWTENTIAFWDRFVIASSSTMLIEVFAASDDIPVLGSEGKDLIVIRKSI